MTTPSDTQPPAGGGHKHGWGAGISLGIAGLVMILLLVLPGFLAAGFSRAGLIYYCVDGSPNWDGLWALGLPGHWTMMPTKAWIPVERIILAPPARIATRSVAGRSGSLMERSPALLRFYGWEYHTAGGLNVDLVE